MSMIVNCPSCERQLRVPDELQGRQVKCPTCGSGNVIVGSTDYEASDFEQSTCLDCGASWGGALFWK